MIKSLPLFIFVLLSSLSVMGQVELPLEKNVFTTRSINGEVISPRRLTHAYYSNDSILRVISVLQDSTMGDYLETWKDEEDRVIMVVSTTNSISDTTKHFYRGGKPWIDVSRYDHDGLDTTRYVYRDNLLIAKYSDNAGFPNNIDSLYYDDTTHIRTVRYLGHGTLHETINYRYNTKKGLVYETTSRNADGIVTTRSTVTYTSQRKIKSKKSYRYSPFAKKRVIDSAVFYKYNYDGLVVQTRTYNYLAKTVKKTINEFDDQGRVIRSVSTSPHAKGNQVMVFETEYQ